MIMWQINVEALISGDMVALVAANVGF